MEAVNLFDPACDEAGLQVESLGDLDAVQIDRRVVAAFGEHVDQHGEGERIVEEGVLGVDEGHAGNRVADHDGDDFFVDERDDAGEERGLLEGVGVETFHHLLAGVDDDFAGDGNDAQDVVGAGVEFERALVLKLLEDVLLNSADLALGVDEVVMEDFLQRLEGLPSLLLEHAVTAFGQGGIVVGGAFLQGLADTGAKDFFVVGLDLQSALELAFHRGVFVDEEHHDVNGGLAEIHAERRMIEIAPQRLDAVHEELEALDLDLGAGEPVKDDAIPELGFQQAAQEEANDLAVAHHAAGVLDALGFGRVQQRADDDGFAGEPAGLGDEIGVGALAGAGGAAEKNDLLGEAQGLAAHVVLQRLPYRAEDQMGVLDFEILMADALNGEVRRRGGGIERRDIHKDATFILGVPRVGNSTLEMGFCLKRRASGAPSLGFTPAYALCRVLILNV